MSSSPAARRCPRERDGGAKTMPVGWGRALRVGGLRRCPRERDGGVKTDDACRVRIERFELTGWDAGTCGA